MKKFLPLLLFVIGIICLFYPSGSKQYDVYLQVVGICLCMFSLYKISGKLTSKESEDKNNLN